MFGKKFKIFQFGQDQGQVQAQPGFQAQPGLQQGYVQILQEGKEVEGRESASPFPVPRRSLLNSWMGHFLG